MDPQTANAILARQLSHLDDRARNAPLTELAAISEAMVILYNALFDRNEKLNIGGDPRAHAPYAHHR